MSNLFLLQGLDGCFSEVGLQGGPQELSLAPGGCLSHGTIMHEFLHALGFRHMQSTHNRDDYVKILWENLKDGMGCLNSLYHHYF